MKQRGRGPTRPARPGQSKQTPNRALSRLGRFCGTVREPAQLEGAESCADRLFCVVNGTRIWLSEFTRTVIDERERVFHVYENPPVHQGDNTISFLLDGIHAPDPWPRWMLCDVAVRYGARS